MSTSERRLTRPSYQGAVPEKGANLRSIAKNPLNFLARPHPGVNRFPGRVHLPIECENAQKRILEVFGQWKAPANFKIGFFVICVGEWGGHMLAAMNL